MASHRIATALGCLLATASLFCSVVQAAPVTPTRDDEVIEVLPAASGDRATTRRLRLALAANPRDARSALALARIYLDQGRTQGDPRFVGQALAVLAAWPDLDTAPDDVALMMATLQQSLHDFDTAATTLEWLVARRPGHAQAWLTLATVRRVQGRYADSDKACAGVAAAGAAAYAGACHAENASLRGDAAGARAALTTLLRDAALQTPDMQNWLLTTLAESEARAGLAAPAEAAYRRAMQAQADGYTALSFADFYMQHSRFAEALQQLRDQPRTDVVLLRRVIAGNRVQSPAAAADERELRERMALAALRPEARVTHAREHAMFALWIDKQPHAALAFARENVRHQREPLDLIVLAQAAVANADAGARSEASALARQIGLHDTRLDAALTP